MGRALILFYSLGCFRARLRFGPSAQRHVGGVFGQPILGRRRNIWVFPQRISAAGQSPQKLLANRRVARVAPDPSRSCSRVIAIDIFVSWWIR